MNLATFDLHANVRVALHECRTPHARSLKIGPRPSMPSVVAGAVTQLRENTECPKLN